MKNLRSDKPLVTLSKLRQLIQDEQMTEDLIPFIKSASDRIKTYINNQLERGVYRVWVAPIEGEVFLPGPVNSVIAAKDDIGPIQTKVYSPYQSSKVELYRNSRYIHRSVVQLAVDLGYDIADDDNRPRVFSGIEPDYTVDGGEFLTILRQMMIQTQFLSAQAGTNYGEYDQADVDAFQVYLDGVYHAGTLYLQSLWNDFIDDPMDPAPTREAMVNAGQQLEIEYKAFKSLAVPTPNKDRLIKRYDEAFELYPLIRERTSEFMHQAGTRAALKIAIDNAKTIIDSFSADQATVDAEEVILYTALHAAKTLLNPPVTYNSYLTWLKAMWDTFDSIEFDGVTYGYDAGTPLLTTLEAADIIDRNDTPGQEAAFASVTSEYWTLVLNPIQPEATQPVEVGLYGHDGIYRYIPSELVYVVQGGDPLHPWTEEYVYNWYDAVTYVPNPLPESIERAVAEYVSWAERRLRAKEVGLSERKRGYAYEGSSNVFETRMPEEIRSILDPFIFYGGDHSLMEVLA